MQDFFVALLIGLILGWLIEWLIDWRVWRPQLAALRQENAELRAQIAALAQSEPVTPVAETTNTTALSKGS